MRRVRGNLEPKRTHWESDPLRLGSLWSRSEHTPRGRCPSLRPLLCASQKGRHRFFLSPPHKSILKYESSFLGLLAVASSFGRLRKVKSTSCNFSYCAFLKIRGDPRLPIRVRGNAIHRSCVQHLTHFARILCSCGLLGVTHTRSRL